ncbi:MAG: hypothetical protein LBR15_03855 [Methanobrevibacter sp.]|jgi:hypothetical protein|nr:hypothetical protein [Candidatus Methanovirga australis]
MKSQNFKRLFVIIIVIFCFVNVFGFISAFNPELSMDDAKIIASNSVWIFLSSDCVVQDGTYYENNTYIFPVFDVNINKTIGNVFVDGQNGTCTSDFLTKDNARNQIYTYLKDNFPDNGNGLVPQTPEYISNVHYGIYGFKVLICNFNDSSKSFFLFIDGNGVITD